MPESVVHVSAVACDRLLLLCDGILVLCDHPYLVSVLFAFLLSLHLLTFYFLYSYCCYGLDWLELS